MNASQDDIGDNPQGEETAKSGIVSPLLFGNEDTKRCNTESSFKIAEQAKK